MQSFSMLSKRLYSDGEDKGHCHLLQQLYPKLWTLPFVVSPDILSLSVVVCVVDNIERMLIFCLLHFILINIAITCACGKALLVKSMLVQNQCIHLILLRLKRITEFGKLDETSLI